MLALLCFYASLAVALQGTAFWTKREKKRKSPQFASLLPLKKKKKKKLSSAYKYRQTNAVRSVRWLQVLPAARPSAAQNYKNDFERVSLPSLTKAWVWNKRSESHSNGGNLPKRRGILHKAFCLQKEDVSTYKWIKSIVLQLYFTRGEITKLLISMPWLCQHGVLTGGRCFLKCRLSRDTQETSWKGWKTTQS